MWLGRRRLLASLGGAACALLLAPAASPSAAGAAHSSAVVPAGLVYGGQTSQGLPIVLQLSRDRKRVAKLLVAYGASCSDGSGLDSATQINLIRLSSSRAFRRSIHGTAPLAGGQVATFDETAAGRVGVSRAKGTYRAQITVKDQAGNTVNVCTAAFTWSALA